MRGRSPTAYERFSAAVDVPMMVLALLWLPVLVLPFIIKLPPGLTATFEDIDYSVWAAFVVEYLVKLWLTPVRRTFFTHHLVDLAVIVLPMLRPLRAARLLRFLDLFRVGVVLVNALRRAKDVFTHRGLHFVLLAVGLIVFACAGLVLSFEADAPGSNIHNFGDAIWWAIVTVTTVGYGGDPMRRRPRPLQGLGSTGAVPHAAWLPRPDPMGRRAATRRFILQPILQPGCYLAWLSGTR
jgi:voltage-gated potassium channel